MRGLHSFFPLPIISISLPRGEAPCSYHRRWQAHFEDYLKRTNCHHRATGAMWLGRWLGSYLASFSYAVTRRKSMIYWLLIFSLDLDGVSTCVTRSRGGRGGMGVRSMWLRNERAEKSFRFSAGTLFLLHLCKMSSVCKWQFFEGSSLNELTFSLATCSQQLSLVLMLASIPVRDPSDVCFNWFRGSLSTVSKYFLLVKCSCCSCP